MLPALLGMQPAASSGKSAISDLPELLEELNVAKGMGTFKKVIAAYRKVGRKRKIASTLTFLGGCFTATYI